MPRPKTIPWTIQGFASSELIFESSMPANLGDREIVTVLQRLASRHLSAGEVVAASKRRNQRGYAPLLEPLISSRGKRYLISVGSNPHYIAWKPYPPGSMANVMQGQAQQEC